MPRCTTALSNCLLCSTVPYDLLLLPTLPHFCPHDRLLFAVVKGKTQHYLKKLERCVVRKPEENHRHTLCSVTVEESIPSVRLVAGFYSGLEPILFGVLLGLGLGVAWGPDPLGLPRRFGLMNFPYSIR